ncbi:MAG: hypothetical protein PUG45_06085 [bacterium]|nr:hypothetical protein [bacterium]MDD7144337.1 hypothetical protein [bacterium]MDY5458375.1 hypothetical protein [Bariatricus sp.]
MQGQIPVVIECQAARSAEIPKESHAKHVPDYEIRIREQPVP